MALFTHDTAIESRPKSASAVYVSRITRIFVIANLVWNY